MLRDNEFIFFFLYTRPAGLPSASWEIIHMVNETSFAAT